MLYTAVKFHIIRDFAETAGGVLVVSLVLDDDELDLVPGGHLYPPVHLRHMEKQLLARLNLVRQETILQTYRKIDGRDAKQNSFMF